MGVTQHWALGIQKKNLISALDRTQKIAEDMRDHQAAPLNIPFIIQRRSPTLLKIDIGECETVLFEFNTYEGFKEEAEKQAAARGMRVWCYETEVLKGSFSTSVLHTRDSEHLKRWPDQRLYWAAGFCKTQFARSLVEHRFVAELIRSLAAVADYAHVADEGAYYHTLKIDDAAESIHENGMLINSVVSALTGLSPDEVSGMKGGETTITPKRRKNS